MTAFSCWNKCILCTGNKQVRDEEIRLGKQVAEQKEHIDRISKSAANSWLQPGCPLHGCPDVPPALGICRVCKQASASYRDMEAEAHWSCQMGARCSDRTILALLGLICPSLGPAFQNQFPYAFLSTTRANSLQHCLYCLIYVISKSRWDAECTQSAPWLNCCCFALISDVRLKWCKLFLESNLRTSTFSCSNHYYVLIEKKNQISKYLLPYDQRS